MPTNNFPGIVKKTKASNRDYYQKVSISATDFGSDSIDGYQPDLLIPFSTRNVLIFNESSGSGKVVEYSFDGITVHGETDPTLVSKTLTFDNRTVCLIWFRVKAGSTGPIIIRIDAWC